jgi:hypothetical protein
MLREGLPLMPLQGRRLPDHGYRDRDTVQPGDYWLTEDHRSVWVVLPHPPNWAQQAEDPLDRLALAQLPVREGDTTELGRPAWQMVEHEDGTITITPSIHDTSEGGYHGFLTNGCWSDG